MRAKDEKAVSFGFRNVGTDEKSGLVRGVFDSVAGRYDLMNDVMSGGVHRLWKSAFVTRVNPQPGQRLLDIAGGTGDIAAAFLKRADDRPNTDKHAPANAILCDINFEMLKAGMAREHSTLFGARLAVVCGDAQQLPIPDKCIDACTIAFGIRNVTKIEVALNEAFRVLKPGGRFLCLEFSHPITEGLQNIYDAYSYKMIPWLGETIARDADSYRYLVESIRRFPVQDAFAQMIQRAGFSRVRFENLTGGIAAIHAGWRI